MRQVASINVNLPMGILMYFQARQLLRWELMSANLSLCFLEMFRRRRPTTSSEQVVPSHRREGAAYAITYARSFPHDQVHYHDQMGIVSGIVPVPRINLANVRLTQRHINSFLLGHFLRGASISSPRELITVEDFFLSPSPEEAPAARYGAWLEERTTFLSNSATHLINEACSLGVEAFFEESIAMLGCVDPRYWTSLQLTSLKQTNSNYLLWQQEELSALQH